jgi:hypothetical protein
LQNVSLTKMLMKFLNNLDLQKAWRQVSARRTSADR